MWALGIAIAAIVVALAVGRRGPWLAPVGNGLGVWVLAGSVAEIAQRARFGSVPLGEAFRRLGGLPRSAWGTAIAHFGTGLMTVGIVAMSAYQSEQIVVMRPGQVQEISGYTLTFKGVAPQRGPNYREEIGVLEVARGGKVFMELTPSKRLYDAPRQSTSEAGIHASWRGDLYAILGDAQSDGAFVIRLYFNPLVRFIWIGTVIMFIGGFLSLSDRRLRIGAPQRARGRPAAVPAE